jgi:NADH-quinone oxidoreductase subunit G
VGKPLPWISFDELRMAMRGAHPHLARIDDAEAASWADFGTPGAMDAAAFTTPIENFYMTDPISRASETMAECTQTFVLDRNGKGTGTHG